jgi:Zn-dependent protease with chaperone function
MPADALYPPAPPAVPREITRIDAAYRRGVVAMIAGLFAFLLLYLAIIAAAAWVGYAILDLPTPDDRRGRTPVGFLILKFGGGLAAFLLVLFLVKGLFKGQRVERSNHVEVTAADHPELLAFIRRVYQDTGAPAPHRVFVSPDVNAALIYNTSLVNLVVPPRKDLLIGLGLVNVVTLVEFKAVLAHEFGHFAQRSVGLGSYLYVANKAMSDVIYSRDGLDRFVDQWAGIDIRLSFPAWGLKAVLWAVRQALAAAYRSLNLLHLSLGRQMEFNADNVAVSVSGSDALIHCLARLSFAQDALNDAAESLNAAADHGLFSDDLFLHQAAAAARLRKLRKDDRAGLPPDLPADPTEQVQVFEPTDDGVPDKYRSHPTDHMRERNAKRVYVRSPQDDRSPWLLFGELAKLKQVVTMRFYEHALGRKETYHPTPAADVQAFIDAEHAESTYDPKYHGLYDDRLINPGEPGGLPVEPWPRDRVAAWLADWPPAGLEGQLAAYRRRQGEFHLLNGLHTGEFTLKGRTFTFREKERTKGDVAGLLKAVDGELEADREALDGLDREAYHAHWSLAAHLDGGAGEARAVELRKRYRFHLATQGLLRGLFAEQGRLHAVLGQLRANNQLTPDAFQQACEELNQVNTSLTANLADAKGVPAPAMTNVADGTPLHALIHDRGNDELPRLYGDSISGEWIGRLMARLDGVIGRVKRVHFKSLGSLLAFQERLAAEWRAAG